MNTTVQHDSDERIMVQSRLEDKLSCRERFCEKGLARKKDHALARHVGNTKREETLDCYVEATGTEDRSANKERLCTRTIRVKTPF